MDNQYIIADATGNIMVQSLLDSTKKLLYFQKETENDADPINCILVQLFSLFDR